MSYGMLWSLFWTSTEQERECECMMVLACTFYGIMPDEYILKFMIDQRARRGTEKNTETKLCTINCGTGCARACL